MSPTPVPDPLPIPGPLPQGIALVTGASGFLGGRLARTLARSGWEVRALVRRPSEFQGEVGVKAFACELPDRIDPAGLVGARVLVHCAWTTRFRDLESARSANEDGTRRLIELARKAGVERCVFISSQSAHAGARSYYGRSKLAMEGLFDPGRDLILRSGLILAREGDSLFHRMVATIRHARVVPLFGGGRQPLQTIHADELSAVVALALRRGTVGRFTTAHPQAIEMREFLRLVARRLGRRPVFVPFPIFPALLALRAIERLRIPFPVSSENLLGLAALRADDTRRDIEALGVPLRSTEESLDEVLPGTGGPPA